ncbi:MAG: LPS export ABC transporter periplasmic protein LptC [bacterium]|nr:MAG: LPS export ABC transporter periplasmic protein LptC [bacterium]
MNRTIHNTVFALALLTLLFAACGSGEKSDRSISASDLPDQEFIDFETAESDSGFTKWVLRAPVARVYNARKLLVTDQPEVEFYNEKGEIASVLTADKGEYNDVTKDLTALGNVVVTSQEGYKLETESLVWIDETGEIHTEDFVRFTKENDILTGYGFESDPELKGWEIKRDVRAYLKDEEGIVGEEVEKERTGKDK